MARSLLLASFGGHGYQLSPSSIVVRCARCYLQRQRKLSCLAWSQCLSGPGSTQFSTKVGSKVLAENEDIQTNDIKPEKGRKKTPKDRASGEPPPHENQESTGTEAPTFDELTIVHQPSRKVIDMKLASGATHVSLYFRGSKEMINLTLRRDQMPDTKELLANDPVDNETSLKSLSDNMWKEMKPGTLKELPGLYAQMAKIRLTGLVVTTTMAGYAMAPAPFDPLTFVMCSVGTALTSAAANSINQYLEIPYDSQMNRTKNRPLVRGALSPLHAVGFAATAATTGTAILYWGTNPLTAGLGLFNLLLYTMAYTPMKRLSVWNTWVGSIVGAIPPVMGWTACAATLDPGALLLASIMFTWQFPHFNALSWNLRQDYSRAGYRMMSVVNPARCKRVALRYSVAMIGLCTLSPVLGVTSWLFAADSLPFNIYLTYLAWNFYRKGDSNSSRKLFRFTLIHIPAVLLLMLVSKNYYGDEQTKEEQKGSLEKVKNKVKESVISLTKSAA